MSDDPRENDFERESSRLNEGLKSCRAMIDSYRSMIAESQNAPDEDDLSRYVPTTGSAPRGSEGDSAVN